MATMALIARKPSTKHEGCDIVLYDLGSEFVTWVEYARGSDYPVGYKAWGHYYPTQDQALRDFEART